MSRVATSTLQFVHEKDPKVVIQENVGNLDAFHVHGPRILVGVYEPSKDGPKKIKMASGVEFHMPDVAGGTTDEYKFQGRACLVLKKGPLAFKDDEANQFHGDDVQEGDWIVIRPTDGNSISIGKQMCRLVNDHHVQMTIPNPDAVF